jgi:hypothetical protein
MARVGRRLPVWSAVLLLAGVTASAQAQDEAPGRVKAGPPDERNMRVPDERSLRVDEALRLSDLKADLAAIRTRLLGYLDANQTSHETKQWIAGSLKTVYSPAVYLTVIKQGLLDNYDADAMTRVLG